MVTTIPLRFTLLGLLGLFIAMTGCAAAEKPKATAAPGADRQAAVTTVSAAPKPEATETPEAETELTPGAPVAPTPPYTVDEETAPAQSQPVARIHRASEPVVIDGKLDEAIWQKSEPIEAVYEYKAQGKRADRPQMIARYAWDENYLYIGYEVFDQNLRGASSGREFGPDGNRRPEAEVWAPEKKTDLAEFFLSFGSPHFFWEIHQNPANHFNDLWIERPDPSWEFANSSLLWDGVHFIYTIYLEDHGPITVARAVQPKPKADGEPSTVNDDSDEDTGYTAEIRLPWTSLGPPKSRAGENGWNMAGQVMPILTVYMNGDLLPEKMYYHSSPTMPEVKHMFHNETEHWPRYELVE